MRMPEPLPTLDEIRAHLDPYQVTHLGVTTAAVLAEARAAIHERKAAGLHGEMGFTYLNPDRSTDPSRAVRDARSVIVAARPYLTDADPERPAETLGPHARVGRYAWVDHYAPLRAGLRSAAKLIRAAGHRAVAFADDNSIVDRAVAHRAGLGWFGKNANLLLPGAGSFFVLGSIVTTAEYQPNRRLAPDGCGTCTACFAGCPTDAIIAPAVIDANRCLSWVMQKPGSIPHEFRVAIGDRIYGCDDCQDVCPISVRLGQRNTVELPDEVGAWVDALALLAADDEWIEARYGSWYIAGRDFDILRRNALIVVGNVGDPSDSRVHDTVERYRFGPDRLLAEHAEWAAGRLATRRPARNSTRNSAPITP
ncbi:MAG: tRNA epoxyqueuosine(34) reductase QueG [Ilumatobacter sp.]|nr:tRNA epoxyqueuosine(34) reductase QueG [Ilumatobacter sp.]